MSPYALPTGQTHLNKKPRASAYIFYRMARRSATECAAILDICTSLNLTDENLCSKSRGLLLRIVSMLTKMARTSSVTLAGTQAFT